MHKFGKYLTDYMNRKNISYRKAALAIDMDRSQFRRYAIGDRLPKSEEVVGMIADGIGMSEEESERLFNYYYRSVMGEQKYHWYKTFEKLLNADFKTYKKKESENKNEKDKSDTDCDWMDKQSFHKKDVLMNINSREETEASIRKVCSGASYIKIMLQTRIYDFYEIIFKTIRSDNECKIEHIVQLNNINLEDDTSDIKIFEKLYKMMKCGRKYEAFYTYNYFDDNINSNYIISDKGLIVFNVLGDKGGDIVGIYTDKDDILEYYYDTFTKMKSKSYVYGYSCKDLEIRNYKTDKRIENKVSGIKTGLYEEHGKYGMWIFDESEMNRPNYICIEENNIVNYFDMYIKDYNDINDEEDVM